MSLINHTIFVIYVSYKSYNICGMSLINHTIFVCKLFELKILYQWLLLPFKIFNLSLNFNVVLLGLLLKGSFVDEHHRVASLLGVRGQSLHHLSPGGSRTVEHRPLPLDHPSEAEDVIGGSSGR